ncbi:putative spermidine/putrescine transport system ATP-binding protein [Roseiarcus fermentans]|uniref:Putative spermidine/putrescine transport system ATP-binding protein n=1 Tax=Roseiarcus fermentans TaxID=1473586 RepID=A0A366FWI6_9HYPH|nr:ABC transporter ATP-binding protein [Roseiarcus fermentans]RBP18390.1 putative spermidine/putrescine transport system ATP-binding protein [Roseiarcus fermentans]
MSFLELADIRKTFGAAAVVKDFSLPVERGEFVTFLGPSGCGKTTVLRMIAGFETPSAGAIRIAGADVTHLRANRRAVGMVFQAYALFPNMTVERNIGFGLKVAGRPAAEISRRVTEMLELIKLPQLGRRYPHQLSGGQQQRVSLARALAPNPQILLLDEPLSALDARIRVALREEIRSLQRRLGVTTIFVTHDQEEALSVSDRIVVMNEGAIEQVGTPSDIYSRPKTRFVASFVGTLNMFEGRVVDPARGAIRLGETTIFAAAPIENAKAGDARTIALRPEALRCGPGGGGNVLSAVVEDMSFLGSVVRIKALFGEQPFHIDTFNAGGVAPPRPGATVEIGFAREDVIVLDRP